MNIAVIGTGYVGLVTATCFAESGNHVTGIDTDSRKIDTLNKNELPIYEPGLLELVQRNRHYGRLKFTTDYSRGLEKADLVFLAVGTPQSDEGDADLSGMWKAADSILDAQKRPLIIVIKSTVPVGTNRKLADYMSQKARYPIDVANNPEFLKEGTALDDFMKPDRVVVGVRRPEAAEVLRELYAPFLRTEKPFLVMSPESAEMTKYVANAMLATKISFINEMANLCEKLHADVNEVRKGIGHDQRIGFQFLFPGVGWGGSCFPKDVQALLAMGRRANSPLSLMNAVYQVNDAQKKVLPTKIRQHYGNDLRGKTLAIWGLAFKPRTDDVREAPSLILIDQMLKEGVQLRVHDPEAMKNVEKMYGDRLVYCEQQYEALEAADGLVILTEWQEFRRPDFDQMRQLLRQPVIFDGRNLYEPASMRDRGFVYYAIGRLNS